MKFKLDESISWADFILPGRLAQLHVLWEAHGRWGTNIGHKWTGWCEANRDRVEGGGLVEGVVHGALCDVQS